MDDDRGQKGLSRGAHALHILGLFLTAGSWSLLYVPHWAYRRFGSRPFRLALTGLLGLAILSIGAHVIHYHTLSPEEKAALRQQRESSAARSQPKPGFWETRLVQAQAEREAKQAEADAKKAEDRAQWDRQAKAQTHCQAEVRKKAKYGSKADFPWLDNGHYKDNGARAIVFGRVELMNGFGAMMPHAYKCVYEVRDGRLAVLTDFRLWEG